MNLRSRRGSSTYIMAALFVVGVSLFAVISYNIFQRRQLEMIALERKHAMEALRIRLENAVRSSHFIEKSFIEANPDIEEFLSKAYEALKNSQPLPNYTNNQALRVLDADGKPWLGAGASHRRGGLESCLPGANCPIQSHFFGSIRSQGLMIWAKLHMTLSTRDHRRTGPINPKNPENQFTVEFPLNFAGNHWQMQSLECREGFRAIQLTAPPLELLCAKKID